MTIPTPEDIRSKSSSIDNIFLKAVEKYRNHTPQPDVIHTIDQCKEQALALISEIIEQVRAKDPVKNAEKSAEQLLADQETTNRFRDRFIEVFTRKVNHQPNSVEQGRIIDPMATIKSILIGAARHATSSKTSLQEPT